jgi:hypothetical protein
MAQFGLSLSGQKQRAHGGASCPFEPDASAPGSDGRSGRSAAWPYPPATHPYYEVLIIW